MEKLNISSNTSSTSWLSNLMLEDMEMDGCDLLQQNLYGDDEDFLSHDIASVLQQQQQPLYCESYSSFDPLERPNKIMKTNSDTFQDVSKSNSPVSSHSSTTSSQVLSFAFDCTLNTKQNEVVPLSKRQLGKNEKGSLQNENVVKRCLDHNKDHIIAERNRRQKLNKSLIALAALIPGLKKMDKASVLGDAIKYLKELQERLKVLEEHDKNSPVESLVTDNKPQVNYESWSDDGSESIPNVDARVLDNDILLRFFCQKQKGLLLKLLEEIQKLHLFVVNSSVLPFGDSIHITIVAKMGKGYNLTGNDIVKHLRVAAFRSMS